MKRVMKTAAVLGLVCVLPCLMAAALERVRKLQVDDLIADKARCGDLNVQTLKGDKVDARGSIRVGGSGYDFVELKPGMTEGVVFSSGQGKRISIKTVDGNPFLVFTKGNKERLLIGAGELVFMGENGEEAGYIREREGRVYVRNLIRVEE